MGKKHEIIYQGNYMALWSDGGICVDDGVGYVGNEDAESLYLALKKYFETK